MSKNVNKNPFTNGNKKFLPSIDPVVSSSDAIIIQLVDVVKFTQEIVDEEISKDENPLKLLMNVVSLGKMKQIHKYCCAASILVRPATFHLVMITSDQRSGFTNSEIYLGAHNMFFLDMKIF